jgi:Nose resistant-to-fluoxetine protein, N-terminal domain
VPKTKLIVKTVLKLKSVSWCKLLTMIVFAILLFCFPIINTLSEESFYDEQMFLSARKFVTGVRSINKAKFNSTIVDASRHSDKLCLGQVENIAEGLARGDLWAVEIYDTWTKLQFGLLEGNVVDFGLFDKCVRLRRDMGDDGEFRGQHCMTGFRANVAESNQTSGFLPRNL